MIEQVLQLLIRNLKTQFYLLLLPLSIIVLFKVYKQFYPTKTPTKSSKPKIKRPELKTELPNEVVRLSSVKAIPRKDFGITDLEWLKSEHLFNFGTFKKENNEGFGFCRSFNFDKILPNEGYDALKKQDYQIFYFVLSGSLEYADHLENLVNLKSNSVALITSGEEGIVHITRNGSPLPLTYLSLWFAPNESDLKAEFNYEQSLKFVQDGFTPLVSPVSRVKNDNNSGDKGNAKILEFEKLEALPNTLGINSDTYITHFHLSPDSSLIYDPKLIIDPENPKKTRKLIIYGLVNEESDSNDEIIINYEYILESGGGALLLVKQGIENKAEDVMLHNLGDKEFRGIIIDMS